MTKEERRAVWFTALQEIFPDHWELQGNNVIIYFPEITIRNSLELEHVVKDLFVRLAFTSDFNLFTEPVGRRLTFTIREFLLGYAHSHLNPPGIEWSEFCLGETQFGREISKLRRMGDEVIEERKKDIKITSEMVYNYLLNLDSYVRWESLEGGPYRRMEDLSNWKRILSVNSGNFCKDYVFTDKDLNYYYKKALPYMTDLDIVPQGMLTNLQYIVNNDYTRVLNHINEINCCKGTNKLIDNNVEDMIKTSLKHSYSSSKISEQKFKEWVFTFDITDKDTFTFQNADIGMPVYLQQQLIKKLNEDINTTAKAYFLTA